MTEEIIIDGVNVAGCCNLDEWKHCNICQELIKTIPNRHQCLVEEDLRCEFYPNCYYKQLKRLEQEHNTICYNLGLLEQENKELKKENVKVKKEFNNLIAEIISDIEYTGEIACNGDSPKEHLKKCQKALKALKEIREDIRSFYGCEDSSNDYKLVNMIDKINEVLNNET